MFENGVTNVDKAIGEGIEEVKNLGSAVGDLASDAWNAIF